MANARSTTWLREVRAYWAGVVEQHEDKMRRERELTVREGVYGSTSNAIEDRAWGEVEV